MTPPSPSSLDTPDDNFRDSPGHGINASTGRPSKWTASHKRKMARLYVYTTLPLAKIIEVVYHNSPLSREPPGRDSANKNLKELLDKEPRWIHPKTDEDMGRRVEQLALSPSRMSSRSSDSSHSRASFDPPGAWLLPVDLKSEESVSPTMLEVPPIPFTSWSAPTTPMSFYTGPLERSPAPQHQPPRTSAPLMEEDWNDKESKHRQLFASFLRRATVTSSSTVTSTTSLKTVLADYSNAYRGVVKGLIRRFTGFSPRRNHMSPVSETKFAVTDWLKNEESPASHHDGPFPLPDDFLRIDEHLESCRAHERQSNCRLCSAVEELCQEPDSSLPWVKPTGLTEKGCRILRNDICQADSADVDAFGNTILHFVAARGNTHLLCDVIMQLQDPNLLKKVNSAGQTFLHAMHPHNMLSASLVAGIMSTLQQHNANVYAQDHYGRNIFHLLQTSGISEDVLNRILTSYDAAKWNTRDAFGNNPYVSTAAMTLDASLDSILPRDSLATAESIELGEELRLLDSISRAINRDSKAEDLQGRNALHALAAAKLTMASRPESGHRPIPTVAFPTSRGRRRRGGAKAKVDAAEEAMKKRLESLRQLLNAGVSPNAYDASGNTPLMAFVALLPEDGNKDLGPDILKLLIAGGADVNARNRAGETALHVAVRCGRKLAARTLVDKGANVHARDAMGRSVLDVADAKIMVASEVYPEEYAHLEACRAWLSGQKAGAVQNPTVLQEWGYRQ